MFCAQKPDIIHVKCPCQTNHCRVFPPEAEPILISMFVALETPFARKIHQYLTSLTLKAKAQFCYRLNVKAICRASTSLRRPSRRRPSRRRRRPHRRRRVILGLLTESHTFGTATDSGATCQRCSRGIKVSTVPPRSPRP